MRRFHPCLLLVSSAVCAAADPAFDAARAVLETRCLECHTEGKSKGGLLMTTREALAKGGEGGPAILADKPTDSPLLARTRLPDGDTDLMPPEKHGPRLTAEETAALQTWIGASAPWPSGETLSPRKATDLPRWDAPPDPQIAMIEAFPKAVSLETAADEHRVVILARFKDAATHNITGLSKVSLADPSLAKLDGTLLTPLKDGSTKLLIEYRGLKTEVPVTVKDATKPRPVSFQLDVMPVLTAAGCNTGSCHGSARGQDGFMLSIYAYDPKGDFERLTTQIPGRRINLAVPEDSLLLTKAIGAVPHTGGALMKKDSRFYETLRTWIADGARYDQGEIPQATAITIEPPQVVLAGPDVTVPYTVRATYTDGSDRDVTRLSVFSTSNDNSVTIQRGSNIATSKNRGEAFLLARYHTLNEVTQAIVIPKDPAYQRPEFPAFNYIDPLVADKLNKLRVLPSGLCDDEAFLRRVHLDLIGALPTPERRAAFLTDTRPDKRALLVDELINRKEFTEMWVMKWAELMQIRTFNNGAQQVSYKAALNYYQWLRERIAANMPFNQLVRELLSAEGGTFANPATNYFQIEENVLKLTENVAQVFMGTRIQCAQCHDHPFDRWTMGDYYSFASFFAQVKRKPAEDPRERIVFDADGEVQHPVTKQNAVPKYLGGPKPDLAGTPRRKAVANWLTAPDNPWFARNVANIVWAHFLGVGIVDPVDDVRVSNPPSNPELLNALAAKFVEYNFDMRKLVRDICTSRTYQLSTRTNPSNETDSRNFSHAMIRRVRAEVLLDCISQATATPNKFKGLPSGARAVQIADGNTTNYFLTTFGRATRATVCSCEVKMEPNLSQALHLLNGDSIHQRIIQGKVVPTLIEAKKSPTEILDTLYLTALSRPPTDDEKKRLAPALAEAADPKKSSEILEDIFWALLNSKEFIFNH
ncbi:MAG: PSD1 domain-containing protein [Verrucomicrobia bacterium]|nr:PSD1 domain-containing protein [Verrucomicrobiota bacterium]